MIQALEKYINTSANQDADFSIIIPTWNNLAYLQLCVSSIKKHATTAVQIIIFVNEGSDGTLAWLKEQNDIDFIYSPKNVGICYALNYSVLFAKANYIMYMNDDMYVLPNWDGVLKNEIADLKSPLFMLSATMIEPFESGNKCVIVKNFGTSLANFKEEVLLKEASTLGKKDWQGSSWPPIIVHKELWHTVGGFSTEFSPGMYSDPDFSMKLYQAGVRTFKGVGTSLVYHFGSKTTHRVAKNNKSKNLFLLKWRISARAFYNKTLQLGANYKGELIPKKLSFIEQFILKLKRKWKS